MHSQFCADGSTFVGSTTNSVLYSSGKKIVDSVAAFTLILADSICWLFGCGLCSTIERHFANCKKHFDHNFVISHPVPYFAETMIATNQVLLAPSPAAKYDAMYYLKGAAAGGICCSITHGALTPVDVVKTRVQLDSVKVSIFSTESALEHIFS
jgi:hypothetical protein